MPGQKILCVAEKPAIAKAVAQHLAGGRVTTVGRYRAQPSSQLLILRSNLYEVIHMSRTTNSTSISGNGATAP
jgi:DNA topoisomerase IA